MAYFSIHLVSVFLIMQFERRLNVSSVQAGVAINTDATHMLNDYGVKVANMVDLRVLAVSKLVVTSSRTLAGLTACLLGRQLPKDTVRCSRWGSAQLSDEQRDYAIRNAIASALLYEAIHKNKDPITSVPSSPFDPAVGLKVSAYALWYRPYFDVDRQQQQIMASSKFVLKPKQQRLSSFFCPLRVLHVRLYNASHSACVAVGHMVSDATAEAALRHWQSSDKLQGLSGRRHRVVVKISEAKIPSAFVEHAKSPPSPEGNGSRRCTIGQAAPKIALPKHGATTGGGERTEIGSESPEVAECGEFEGMVLWDLDHMRDAGSYKPPLHHVVDDGGVEYTDNFSVDNLPMGKVVQGGGEFFFFFFCAAISFFFKGILFVHSCPRCFVIVLKGEGGGQPLEHVTISKSAAVCSTLTVYARASFKHNFSLPPPSGAIDSVDLAEDDGVQDEEPLDLDSSVDGVEAGASSTATGTASGGSALPGAASNPPTSSENPSAASSLPVRLDLFHGIVRVTKCIPKGHGAFFLFCALLRDWFFMVNQADIKAVEHVLQNEGKSAADIQNMKAKIGASS